MKYDHTGMEAKWQKQWEEKGVFHASNDSDKPKYYTLIEFPYPSGAGLHVGHPRSNTAMDIIARKRRMEGYNVLFPIGWDAFGLPAENAAIKHHSHPAIWTYENIETQKKSFSRMGFSYDWDRKVVACDPEYYRYTGNNQAFTGGTYYALLTTNVILATVGGLAINGSAQVLDTTGAPIEGLYATGNASGSFYSGNYPRHIPGTSVGRAATFGYVAADHMVNGGN